MKKLFCLSLLFCFGCGHKPAPPAVHINLINNNRSVKLKGLGYAIISEINRDSIQSAWQSLIPVYRMPADTDLKDYQPSQPGVYEIADSAVVFTPDTPFIKGKTYFLRYYQFGEGRSITDYVKGSKKLQDMPYTDLIFK